MDFARCQVPDKSPLNLLPFGLSSAGKSSMTTTLATACCHDKRKLRRVAKARPANHDGEQFTKDYKGIPLTHFVYMFDPWGFTPKANYNRGEFVRMLMGRVRDEHRLDEELDDIDCDVERKIHGVLFIVDKSVQEIPETIDHLRPFLLTATDIGIPVWFVVTKLDLKADELRHATPQQLQETESFKKCKEIIESRCGLPRHKLPKIIPIINYLHDDSVPSPRINEIAAVLLQDIFTHFKAVEVKDVRTQAFDYFARETPINFMFVA